MNQLLKHPILRVLPYNLLKIPEVDKIQKYLQKQRKKFRYIKLTILILYPFVLIFTYIFWDVHYPNKGMIIMDQIANVIPIISLPILAMVFHRLEKQYIVTQEEILEAISSIK